MKRAHSVKVLAMTSLSLQKTENLLNNEAVDCTLLDASEEVPYDRLIVYLGQDYKERERILEITAQEQKFDGLPNKPKKQSMDYVRVQFQVAFPFACDEGTIHEVTSLLLFINRLIELPGLEINELDNRLFYRHVLLTSGSDLDTPLCLTIIGLIMMVLDVFTETIEKIATGQSTFNELLEEMLIILKKF